MSDQSDKIKEFKKLCESLDQRKAFKNMDGPWIEISVERYLDFCTKKKNAKRCWQGFVQFGLDGPISNMMFLGEPFKEMERPLLKEHNGKYFRHLNFHEWSGSDISGAVEKAFGKDL